MVINVLIGNIVALMASILMAYIGLIKEKERVLYVQTIQMGLLVMSNLILSGITGAIMNFLGCIRNILCYKNKLKVKEKIILTFFAIMISILFNNMGILGILPIMATILYTFFMSTTNVVLLKILIISTTLLWLIYDIGICSYTSAIFDCISIITNAIGIFKIKIEKIKEKV